MTDITNASIPSMRKYLAIENAAGDEVDISAYILDYGESLPFTNVSDKPGNAFWDQPLTVGGGIRTVNVPIRLDATIRTIIEDAVEAQASVTSSTGFTYTYGEDSNATGKPNTTGMFVYGSVNLNAPQDSRQEGSFEMQLRSRTRGSFA